MIRRPMGIPRGVKALDRGAGGDGIIAPQRRHSCLFSVGGVDGDCAAPVKLSVVECSAPRSRFGLSVCRQDAPESWSDIVLAAPWGRN